MIPHMYFSNNLRIFSGSSSVFGPGVHDPKIEKLARFRRTRSGRTGRNAARDFHRYVHRDGKTFGVHINSYKIPIRMKIRTTHGKRRRREIEVEHPLILLSQWMAAILTTFPKFFLAGVCPERDGSDAYMQIFSRFWERFQSCQPDHPVYGKTEEERSCTIPIAIHGDEGRGLAKVPLLVIAYQVIIPYSGENNLSSSKYPWVDQYIILILFFIFPKVPYAYISHFRGCVELRHSYTTRLLSTVLPSSWYAKKDRSVNAILQALADDLTQLLESGVTVEACGGSNQPKNIMVISKAKTYHCLLVLFNVGWI